MIPGTFRNVFQTYRHLYTNRTYIVRQRGDTVLRLDTSLGLIYPIPDDEANCLQLVDARKVIPRAGTETLDRYEVVGE